MVTLNFHFVTVFKYRFFYNETSSSRSQEGQGHIYIVIKTAMANIKVSYCRMLFKAGTLIIFLKSLVYSVYLNRNLKRYVKTPKE